MPDQVRHDERNWGALLNCDTSSGGGDLLKLHNDLKRCRFDHDNITQQALADAVGVTRLTIHSVENGKFVPSTVLALKLARFFGKSVEELFFLDEDE